MKETSFLRKNFMFIIAIVMLIISMISLIKFLKHQDTKVGVLCGVSLAGGFIFYLFNIIKERDKQIASLRSKLFKANKQLDKYEKQILSSSADVNRASSMYDINSFM